MKFILLFSLSLFNNDSTTMHVLKLIIIADADVYHEIYSNFYRRVKKTHFLRLYAGKKTVLLALKG